MKYKANNIVREQNDFDELNWNILYTFRDLELDSFTAQVKLTEALTKDGIEIYFNIIIFIYLYIYQYFCQYPILNKLHR
ncbi:MAG: DUF2207 domain-containing protein [Parcubacteria group bacterium]